MEAPLPSAYDRAPVRQIRVADADLAVRTYGDGPDLLLIHGFPLHGYTWRYVLPDLATRHRCTVVDLPGLGDSAWDARTDLGFVAQAARLGGLLEVLGIRRTAILAQDTGGTIARLLAVDRPAAVTHLALINTEIPAHRPPWIREFQLASRIPGARATFRGLLSLRTFRRSGMGLGGLFVDPTRLEGDFHARFVQPLLDEPRRLDGALRFLQGIDWRALDTLAHRHREIACPVQLLWGEQDPTFPVDRAQTMCGQFARGCAFHRIGGAKLLPHEEQPAQVLAQLRPFLAVQARAA